MTDLNPLINFYQQYYEAPVDEKDLFLKQHLVLPNLTVRKISWPERALFLIPFIKKLFLYLGGIDLELSVKKFEALCAQGSEQEILKSAKILRIVASRLNVTKQKELRQRIDSILNKFEVLHPEFIEKAKQLTISKLMHKTPIKNLLSILRDGELLPFSFTKQSGEGAYDQRENKNVVFLSLHPKNGKIDLGRRDLPHPKVILEFSKKLLGRNDYHVSEGWFYGQFRKADGNPRISYLPAEIDRFNPQFLEKENEAVFSNSVSLKYLKKIYVPALEIESLQNLLMSSRILPPDPAKTWNDYIEVMG